jgi:hypothetical protein
MARGLPRSRRARLGHHRARCQPIWHGALQTAGAGIVLAAINGAAIGIVWLMVVKPGWAGSVVVTVVGGGLGATVGAALSRAPDVQPSRVSAPMPEGDGEAS